MVWLIVIGSVLLVMWLLNFKTSRPDGTYLGNIHQYRKMLLQIMPVRDHSVVLYDDFARVDELERYLEVVNPRFHADFTHCIVGAIANGIMKNPSMNRFAINGRLYQRKGTWITFSMKRQKLGKKAKLSAVKRQIPKDQTFAELCEGLVHKIKEERSDKKTYQDKEFDLFLKIPLPLLALGTKLLFWLNRHGLLPASFVQNDAMFTGVFAANLGSLGMNAGYHHLYEWGTCSLFMMIGKTEERVFSENGELVTRRVIPLRFTYDERIDDGLNAGEGIKAVIEALENPFELLGCTRQDGSDDHPIGRPPENKQAQLDARLAR